MSPKFLRITSTTAAVAAGCIAVFLLFWAVLSIVRGGPDAKVGQEAILIGIISGCVGIVAAWAARLFFSAPAKAAAHPEDKSARFALHTSPLFAVLGVGLIWRSGAVLLLYFVFTLMIVLAIQLRKR